MIKVLFLHGSSGSSNGTKFQQLAAERDFDVSGPQLPFASRRPTGVWEWWNAVIGGPGAFSRAVTIAQRAADEHRPDVIVGSSMGGVVAMTIESDAARVLIAPAVVIGCGLRFPILMGRRRVPGRTVILHAGNDELVPFQASVNLLRKAAPTMGAGEAEIATKIERALLDSGYDVHEQRLIRIGKNHSCNDPMAGDRANRDPDPLRAMVTAVRLLAGL